MMISGASLDNVGVLCRLLPIEFHGFTSRIDFLVLFHFFIDGMGLFNQSKQELSSEHEFMGRCKLPSPVVLIVDLFTPKSIVGLPRVMSYT